MAGEKMITKDALLRHALTFILWSAMTFFIGGIAWQSLKAQSQQNQDLSKENKSGIINLDDKLDVVRLNQGVIQEKLRSAAVDRQNIQKSLDRILDEVRRPNQ